MSLGLWSNFKNSVSDHIWVVEVLQQSNLLCREWLITAALQKRSRDAESDDLIHFFDEPLYLLRN